jgi:hypothetical protein
MQNSSQVSTQTTKEGQNEELITSFREFFQQSSLPDISHVDSTQILVGRIAEWCDGNLTDQPESTGFSFDLPVSVFGKTSNWKGSVKLMTTTEQQQLCWEVRLYAPAVAPLWMVATVSVGNKDNRSDIALVDESGLSPTCRSPYSSQGSQT